MTRLTLFIARCLAWLALSIAAPIAACVALFNGASPTKAGAIAFGLLCAAWIIGPSDEARAVWRAACSDD